MGESRSVRIALTHPNASDLGGVERQAHSLAVGLCDAGHEVHYVCERHDESVDPRILLHSVSRGPRGLRAAKVWLFDRRCRHALARAGPFDVVHGFGKTSRQDVYYDGSGCLADFQAWSIDRRLPAWRRPLRRMSLHQRVVGRIERARYTRENFRRVLAISGMVRAQILARHGLAPDEVEVLHPGVDLERFHPRLARSARAQVRAELALPPEAPLLLFLGSDYARKGLAGALSALAKLPGVCLAVVGRDRDERRYRRLAGELGIEGRVRFLGLRPDPEHWLAAADCLVFPTWFDAFGSVVLEALACGTPVVASRRAGASELLLSGETGALVDGPEDAGALAAAVEPFLVPARRRQTGALARSEAERHGWDRHVTRVLEIYGELCAGQASAGAPHATRSGGVPGGVAR
jgi:UDP-glucose:(heptosyl)LPS alpha-1,3-glucosyltransferase